MSTGPTDAYEQKYLSPDERVLFREKIVAHGAFVGAIVFLLLFGVAGLALMGFGVAGVVPVVLGVGLGAFSVAFATAMGVLGALFSVYRTVVTTDHVHVHFGWVKRKIPYSAIASTRTTKQKGFKQGKVQFGIDGVVRTWAGTSKSRNAVEITYTSEGGRKHVLVVGTDEPERFSAALEQARAPGKTRVANETATETPAELAEEAAVAERARAER